MRLRTVVWVSAIVFAVLLPIAQLAAQQQDGQPSYRLVDLGTLGGNCSFAFGINDSGLVEGFSNPIGESCFTKPGIVHAFLWQNGAMTDLGTLRGPNSQAFFGPNERPQVAGIAETSTPDPNGEDFCGFGTHLICLPFLWQAGTMKPLDTLGGNNGQSNDINNPGEASGWAETATRDPACPAPQVLQFKPVFWENGRIHELPTFGEDADGVAFGINNLGDAVGTSGSCAAFDPAFGVYLETRHAVMWRDGAVTDLGNLGGTKDNVAFAVNNVGQVVGTSGLRGDTAHHAFLWQNGRMTDLGTLPGDVHSGATGVSRGRVVGISLDVTETQSRAFLWQNGRITDLNTLISPASPLFLLQATAINSAGEIVGFAFQTNTGGIHAFLAIPTDGSQSTASEVVKRAGGRTNVILSESTRELLRRLPRFGRFVARSVAP